MDKSCVSHKMRVSRTIREISKALPLSMRERVCFPAVEGGVAWMVSRSTEVEEKSVNKRKVFNRCEVVLTTPEIGLHLRPEVIHWKDDHLHLMRCGKYLFAVSAPLPLTSGPSWRRRSRLEKWRRQCRSQEMTSSQTMSWRSKTPCRWMDNCPAAYR